MRLNADRLRLELRRARVPALQYLFVVACAAIALGVIFKNQLFDRPWVAKRTVRAQFENVKGVTPGAQRVRIAGVDVGLITDSEIGDDGKPVLTLEVEKKYGPLYKDAKMRLRPLTPLQDLYIDVDDRGTPNAGELGEDDVLAGGRTESPVDISRVLNTFDPDTRARMRQFITEFSAGLGESGGEDLKRGFVQLAPFLHAAERTSRAMGERRTNLARVMHNLAQLTGALAERDQQLTRLVRDGNTTLGTLASAQGPFDATLAELPRTLAVMRSSFAQLRSAEEELDPALRALRPVAEELEGGLEGLAEFSSDARPALSALRAPLRDLAPLVRDLRPTARSTDQAFNRLRPQAPELDRATAELPPCFKQISSFFNNTLSVFKFYDEFGAFPRGNNINDGDSLFHDESATAGLVKAPSCTDAAAAREAQR